MIDLLNHHPQGLTEGYRLKQLTNHCVAIAAAPDYVIQALCFLYFTLPEYCTIYADTQVDFNKLFYIDLDGTRYYTDSVPVLLNFITGEML